MFIGTNITVKVLGINGNQVRLGIEAPDDVRILRAELVSESVPLQAMRMPPRHKGRRRHAA